MLLLLKKRQRATFDYSMATQERERVGDRDNSCEKLIIPTIQLTGNKTKQKQTQQNARWFAKVGQDREEKLAASTD